MRQWLVQICHYHKALATNLVVLILVLFNSNVAANMDDDTYQDDGTLGAEFPHIPEPMIFDLVRPLGATQGELEMNILARQLSNGNVEWAPEIEYAVRNGLAFEFELPLEDSTVQEYKFAAQGTLKDHNAHFIHGWQVISRYLRQESSYSADMLYIAGYRFNERWSTLNMLGLSGEELAKHTKLRGLANLNVFYNLNKNLAFGIEMNSEFNRNSWRFAFTPQLHTNFTDKVSLQIGVGPSRLHSARTQWIIGSRLIYTF